MLFAAIATLKVVDKLWEKNWTKDWLSLKWSFNFPIATLMGCFNEKSSLIISELDSKLFSHDRNNYLLIV